MPLHMLRLAVGAPDLADMRDWRNRNQMDWHGHRVVPTYTRRMPTRTAELLDGGSLYWVVKGVLCCRARFVGFDLMRSAEGDEVCRMLLDTELVETVPEPKRPFQGWRYLKPEDAPPDLDQAGGGGQDLPPHILAELRQLGLA
ncbi:DUF1489 family protein [Nitrospirillum iridis]|uniref:Lysophospholipase n=1 Tax=Nitrospirillum iridis TaxID=765888 RepID=A0A7X0EEF1_9PROT|nr:DUF1489 domain-containing protein [Nitrospirillum iridis]MBB6253827.1 hypothetical protein [Nitrospirillum iridis]